MKNAESYFLLLTMNKTPLNNISYNNKAVLQGVSGPGVPHKNKTVL